MASFLGSCYLEGVAVMVEIEVVTEFVHVHLPQLCICSHWTHCEISLCVHCGLREHGFWASPWFLASAQTRNRTLSYSRATNPCETLCCSWDHRHQCGSNCSIKGGYPLDFPWQLRPLWDMALCINTEKTSPWPWVAEKTTQNILSPAAAMWPLVAACPKSINTASCYNTSHEYLHGSLW